MYTLYPAFTPVQAAAYSWMAGVTFWMTAIEWNAAVLRGLHGSDMGKTGRHPHHSTPV